MATKKLNVPRLRFPEFQLQRGWAEKRLGETLTIARGGSPRPISDYITQSDDGLNWIKIGDTTPGGKYIMKTQEKIKKEGLSKTRKVMKGDLILSNSMSFGRPYILEIDGCIHDGWLLLRDAWGVYDKLFLYYVLSSGLSRRRLESLAAGGVVSNLNVDIVKALKVFSPSLPEQQKIASFFSLLDHRIEKQQEKISCLEVYKKGLMQKIFSQEIRFKDESGKDFPKWGTKRIGDLFDERTERGRPNLELLSVTISEGVKKRTNIDGKDNSSEDKSNYKVVEIGDIVYNSMRMWQGANGVSSYKGITSPAYTVLKNKTVGV